VTSARAGGDFAVESGLKVITYQFDVQTDHDKK
jgi:hypothetical protein